jgi:hypothetical protein
MLKEIFNKNQCDKSSKHFYELIYEKDFSLLKDKKINILEIGVFRGESMSSWIEYFPNANVYGIDIFIRVKEKDINILSHPRTKHIKADSTKSDIKSIIKEQWPNTYFDIIIDDGLHTPIANKNTFENLIDFLKEDGVFYIEDLWPLDEMSNEEMNHYWIKKHKEDYTKENMYEFLNSLKKYKVEKFDNRHLSKEPDSVIYKIKK